ncbi:MAG: hypothetical protein V4671_30220 [Armatimonadota bacterium]
MQFSQLSSAVRTGVLGLTALGAIVLFAGCGGGGSSSVTPGGGPVVLAPACSNPAPLTGTYDGVPTYIVALTPGTSAAEQAPLLGAKYGFTVQYTFPSSYSPPYFSAELSPEALARLRCDPLVAETFYAGMVRPA